MQLALRPYATTGVAIAGASLIAVTPMAPHIPDLPDIQSRAVQLTSGWENAFNTSSENATTLLNNYFLAPEVGLQQFIVNQTDYWQQLLNDPSGSTNSIAEQMQEHWNAVLTGFTLQNAPADVVSTVTHHTLDGVGFSGHSFLFTELPSFLPSSIDPATVTPIVNFLASPESAMIMGAIGPEISPLIALMNSITDGDNASDTLANMVGAYFNGATLDLDSLLPAINGAGIFPGSLSMTHLDFAFGGLLSPGDVSVGPYQVLGEGGSVVDSVPAVGGSIFNSIGLDMTGVPILGKIDLVSHGIGPIGAMETWSQTVGALLGSGWDGKGPVDVTPPLAGADFPIIDDGGLAADSVSWLQDLVAAL